ncbi:hypothetical protein [Paenibacillus sp. FSL K6-2859]|uniref:hypothetical protein n=1 Tax=Paenibacillus sp. FSL K6-2859 TaxID=2921482 RepID=UPI0030F50161
MKTQVEIQVIDIVKILDDGPENGRFAKVLRIGVDPKGKAIYTLKVNHYWNSSDNILKHGPWKGQMWIAIVLSREEIQLRKSAVYKTYTPQLRNVV